MTICNIQIIHTLLPPVVDGKARLTTSPEKERSHCIRAMEMPFTPILGCPASSACASPRLPGLTKACRTLSGFSCMSSHSFPRISFAFTPSSPSVPVGSNLANCSRCGIHRVQHAQRCHCAVGPGDSAGHAWHPLPISEVWGAQMHRSCGSQNSSTCLIQPHTERLFEKPLETLERRLSRPSLRRIDMAPLVKLKTP